VIGGGNIRPDLTKGIRKVRLEVYGAYSVVKGIHEHWLDDEKTTRRLPCYA
jgi:hypothetical protein